MFERLRRKHVEETPEVPERNLSLEERKEILDKVIWMLASSFGYEVTARTDTTAQLVWLKRTMGYQRHAAYVDVGHVLVNAAISESGARRAIQELGRVEGFEAKVVKSAKRVPNPLD